MTYKIKVTRGDSPHGVVLEVEEQQWLDFLATLTDEQKKALAEIAQ